MARRCGAKHICKSKMHKTPQSRTSFGSSDVQKWHAAVARSTFASQNSQNTTFAEPFLEVAMLKNCMPLWREAHLQVKMHKTPHSRSHFGSCDVEKLHASVARSTFASQNAQKHHIRGAILEVPMFKNGTRLWREAHLEVKMLKN